MRVAALNDVHGNLPALEAVLAEVERLDVDRIVLGGDIASGPLPRQTLDMVLALGERALALHGNADRELVAVARGGKPGQGLPDEVRQLVAWAAVQLEPRHLEYLAKLPPTVILDVDGLGEVLFCHASPRNDVEVFTAASDDGRIEPMLAGVAQRVVICGHTHMQFDRRVGDVRIVNAGSVGMPYGPPGAYWLLLGPTVDLRRTAYELEEAGRRIRGGGSPGADRFARSNMLHPPTAEEAIEFFERSAR